VPTTKDPKTGWTKPVWTQALPGQGKDPEQAREADAVAVAGDTVILLHGTSVVGARLADGSAVWTVKLPHRAINGGLAIAAGQITVVCEDGSIVAIR
jgi:outer membrane protein assembly factor BamB